METKTYVYCEHCQTSFSEFFKDFKKCPGCRESKLKVEEIFGMNLPKWPHKIWNSFNMEPRPYFGNTYAKGEFQSLLKRFEPKETSMSAKILNFDRKKELSDANNL